MKSLKELKAELPQERQEKIAQRAEMLIQGEYVLKALRQERSITQSNLSKILGMDQSAVSRLESRHDFLLSTLNAYIQALGGKLEIQAHFPDQTKPIDLSAVLPQIHNQG